MNQEDRMVVYNVRIDSSKNKTKTGVNCSQEEPESTGQAWGVPEIQWIQETGGKEEREDEKSDQSICWRSSER